MWVVSIDTVLEMKNKFFFLKHKSTQSHTPSLDRCIIAHPWPSGNLQCPLGREGEWNREMMSWDSDNNSFDLVGSLKESQGYQEPRPHLETPLRFIACDPDFEKHSSRKRAITDKLNEVNPISYISSSVFPSCSSGVRRVLWLTPQQQFHIR